jgi:hypothetical protein
VILAFCQHAEQHYRTEEGTPTDEADHYRELLCPLRAM